MKKLGIKKITLRNLEESSLGGMNGGVRPYPTVGCGGGGTGTVCINTKAMTCPAVCVTASTCAGYTCSGC